MKLIGSLFVAVLVLFGCAPHKKSAPAAPLKFSWSPSERFQVQQSIEKNGSTLTVLFDCQMMATNRGFVLDWLGARILKMNGQTADKSMAWQKEVAPLEATFRYASFHISETGEFLEALDVEQMIRKLNRLLDQITPDRSPEARDYYEKLATSKSGKLMTDQILGQIWETWVQAWISLKLAEGETGSQTTSVSLNNHQVPATVTTSNLGIAGTDEDLLNLKCEQRLSTTNLAGALDAILGNLAAETEIKKGDPLPKNVSLERTSILEVHTERQSLKPHWAKRTTTLTIDAPGEPKKTTVEVNEYQFFWKSKPSAGSQ